MAKKAKIVSTQNEGALNSGHRSTNVKPDKMGGRRRSTTAKKSASGGKKKSVVKASLVKQPGLASPLEPSEEEIRVRAYFIAERRHRLALPGDTNSDWLEAKRHLISEAAPR